MKQIDNLTNGSLIRVAGISGKIQICTLAAYCADGHTTVAECVARDREFNRRTEWAWTYQAAAVICEDYPGKREALDAERAAIAAAPLIEPGDELRIDGEPYRADVLGNYSNPVRLTKLNYSYAC